MKQLSQCEKELQRWELAYLNEAITVADFKVKRQDVLTRQLAAQEELHRLDEQHQAVRQAEFQTASLQAYCQRIAKNLSTFSFVEKHEMMQSLDIRVISRPDAMPLISAFY